MREHVDARVLANWVVMLRADADGAIWLVDDDEEARFYERCAHREARVVAAPKIALSLLDSVEALGVHGVVATVRGGHMREHLKRNVFSPSLGDVASLLLRSESSEGVMEQICGTPWFKACEKDVGGIRNRAVLIGWYFEQLHRACIHESVPPLVLENLNELVYWQILELDWERLRSILVRRGLSIGALERVRTSAMPTDLDTQLQQCDGSSVIAVLAAATRLYRPRGIKARTEVDVNHLTELFRVAFNLTDLENDAMFWQMRNWQHRNVRFPLLREWRQLDSLGVVWDQRYWEADLRRILTLLGPAGRLAVLKMDLDNFKAVNEALGHSAGDDAIRLYCSAVQRTIGVAGEVYRRGGDEIVALVRTPDDAEALAEKVRSVIETEFRGWAQVRGILCSPTASIGLVLVGGDRPLEEVVELMDEAQNRAKKAGKNRIVCIDCGSADRASQSHAAPA